MKTNSPKTAGGGKAGSHSDLRQAPRATAKKAPSPAPPQVTAQSAAAGATSDEHRQDRRSLLDQLDQHVRRGNLTQAWEAATAEQAQPLPGRSNLERAFGASLGHVEVFTGEHATSLLDRFGALGAARGHQVLLRDPHDALTAAHEVAHVLQARAPETTTVVVRAEDAAELEAERFARDLPLGRRLGLLQRRLPRTSIALRRAQPREPTHGDLPPVEDDLPGVTAEAPEPLPAADEGEPASERQRRGESGSAGVREGAQVPEEGAAEAPQVEPETEELGGAAGRSEPEVAAGEALPEASPDRRREVDDLLEGQQTNWDDSVQSVEGHEVEACPRSHVGRGERPFARGPPLDVPETEAAADLTNPELEAPNEKALDRAEGNLDTSVNLLPSQTSGVDARSIDQDTDAERRSEQARVRREVDAALREHSLETPETPTTDLSGEADVAARKRGAEEKVQRASQREGQSARNLTNEDFGEEHMAPAQDPTEGHDTALDELEVPSVDLEAEVQESARNRIATDANAGELTLDEVVVPRDGPMEELRNLSADRAQRSSQIDTEISDSDAAFERLCDETCRARETAQADTEREVGERREQWREAVDGHVQTREREANDLVREKTAHADQLAETADEQARSTLHTAQQTAQTQSDEVERRARAKANESEERSWWQRGIDFVREQLNRLVNWIDDFIDRAHQGIDTLLDRASEVAHGFVEAGRRAVTATLELAHRGVDAIADNLPGELGALAREHRDDLHTYLDEQQQHVDEWAQELHENIDTGIEGLREGLHAGLEDFREGVHDVADAANEVLDVAEEGIMALLRRYFPSVASFVDEGILGPVNRAGEELESWAQAALDGVGLSSIADTLNELHSTRFCQEQTEEEQAADCAAFEARLNSLRDTFDAILESPVAQEIQSFLQEVQDQERSRQVDAASGFFSFIAEVARPVYEWWQAVEPQVSEALDFLGDMASAAWRHIATALGLDPNLPPLTAIRQGLERAWEAVSQAVQPLIDRLRQAWQWLTEESPLAPIINFFRAIPGAVTALGDLISEIASSAGDWLASAAETLKNTIMPVVQRALGVVSRALNSVVDRVVGWADRLLGAVDGILSWEPAHRLLQGVMQLVRALATPARLAFQLFRDCGERALRGLADVVGNLVDYARTIMDIATGIVQAILFMPIGTAAFLVGNVWRFMVPECYKAPILNFLLDIAIRFVQFFPEPADFLWAAIYQGLLNFLQGLRAAPDEQKVGAIDLLASMLGGNAEVAAGFAVGLVEGVWESTGGTIVFLLQIVGWLLTLPIKLAQWAIGLVRGQGPGQAETGSDDTAEEEAPEAAPTEGLRSAPTTPEATGNRVRDGPEPEPQFQDTEAASAETEPAMPTLDEEEPSDATGETPDSERAPSSGGDEQATEDEEPLEDSAPTDAIERAGRDAEEPTDETGAGGDVDNDVDPDHPPAVPEALSNFGGTLQQLVTTGFTREDVQQALDGVRDMLRQFIGRLARQAAEQLLASLNAQGAAFAIGRALGNIVGQLVVEAVLALFTGGGSTALTAAKAALRGAQTAGRLGSILRRIRSAIQPLLNAIGRMRSAIGQVVGRLRAWFDDIVRWMRGVGRRIRTRVRRVTRRLTRRRPRARGRPRRRGRRRRGDRDDSANKRRRLNRAVRALDPRITRMLSDGVSAFRLRMTLRWWRVRYRLTVLRKTSTGQFEARVNPRRVFNRARRLPSAELGRILRPVLDQAHEEYRRRLLRNARRRSRVRDAEGRAAAGGDFDSPSGPPLTRGERSEVFARTPIQPRGTATVGDAITAAQDIDRRRPALGRPSTTFIDMPPSIGHTWPDIQTHLTGMRQAGVPARDIARFLSAPRSAQAALARQMQLSAVNLQALQATVALLDLERGRRGAEGAAQLLSLRLGEAGFSTLPEAIGDTRRMGGGRRTSHRAVPRHAGDPSVLDVGHGSRAGHMGPVTMTDAQNEDSLNSRLHRLGNLFQRLERAALRSSIFAGSGPGSLHALGRAVDRFLRVRQSRVEAIREGAIQTLVQELVAFLQTFD